MLQFQDILPIYKIEFWSELTIAILPWGNAELFFGQKYKLTFRLWEEPVKI